MIWRHLGWAVLGLFVSAAAWAGPEDDYKRGMQAYNRGDVVGAMNVLQEPAKAGHVPSQLLLAYIFEGAGYVDDAVKLYREAAERNDPEALFAMGAYHVAGRGVAKDENQGMAYFSKAADLGYLPAIEAVAGAHLRGAATVAGASPEQAVAAVRRAADKGHLASMEALEKAYTTGRWQLPVDPQQAAAWKAKSVALKAQRAAASQPKASK